MDKYPLIGFSIIFISGVISRKFINFNPNEIIIFIASAIIIILVLFRYSNCERIRLLISLLIYLSTLFLGILDLSINETTLPGLPKSFYFTDIKITGCVNEIRLIKNDNFDFIISADTFKTTQKFITTRTKILCRLYGDSKSEAERLYNKLSVGNKLWVAGKLKSLPKAGNPGEYDYSAQLKSRGISGTMNIYKTNDLKIRCGTRTAGDYLFKARKLIDNKIRDLHTRQGSALLRGLLLADRSIIDIELKEDFINSGVVHLLAVSGLHVGYIVLIILVVTGRMNLYVRSVITIAGLIIFALITGMPASVVRATVMAVILIIAFLTGRSTNLKNSLSTAAMLILIISPEELFEPGFQLSFSAVLSIAVFYPAFRKVSFSLSKNPGVFRNLLLFISVSLAAQVGTTPLVLYYFGKMSLVGLILNIFAIPAVGVIVGIGLITLFTGFLIPPLAVYFAAANDMLILIFNILISFSGQLTFSHLDIGNFSRQDILIFYSFLAFITFTFKKFSHVKAKVILFVLVAAETMFFCSLNDPDLLEKNKFNLMMIDVGQGDSFLIKFPNGKTALIDAGIATAYFDNGERRILPLLDYLSVPAIDYAFVSHIDADHYAGFVSLIHSGRIKCVYKPPSDSLSMKDVRFERFLKKVKIPVHYYRPGIKKIGNARLYILNIDNPQNYFKKSTNNGSGFFKIVYGKTAFLFTGDLEKPAELFYSDLYGNFLRSDVLKVSHHGSGGASGRTFLNYVKPEICLISAGLGNKFGHPAAATIKKLRSINATIIRSDSSGAALLRSDGEKIKVIDWR